MNGYIFVILLCLSGGIIGVGVGARLKEAEKDIAEFIKLLDNVKWETLYKRKPLPEIFRDHICTGRQREFIDRILVDRSPSGYLAALKEYYPQLSAEESEACEKLALLFDGRDIDSQLSMIDSVRESVDSAYEKRAAYNKRHIPMYRSLGFVLGALSGFLFL